MAKWHLLVEEDYYKPRVTLVCTDVGKITSVNLEHDVDNYPCVAGEIIAEGARIIFHQKHSATAAYQGIFLGHNPEFGKTVPRRVPVHCSSKNAWANVTLMPYDRLRDIPKNVIPKTYEVKKLPEYLFSHWEIDYVIADPRVIWMAFYVCTSDSWLSAKMCSNEVPTTKEAIENLQRYGLYRPFSCHNKCPDDVYETMSQIWFDHVKRHHEESVVQLWGKPVHFEETTILPDKKFDSFVKQQRVVGSFAVPYFEYTLERLKPNMRAKLIREPGNPHDQNAIRVEAPFIWGEKIGYIPRTDAAVFAPEIDKGIAYSAWISSVDREKKQVFIDIYKHVQFPLDNVTGIHFIQNGYKGPQVSFDLSLIKRSLNYTRRESWGDIKEQQIEIIFDSCCWENIISDLCKCNLPGWRRTYIHYGETYFWALEIRRRNASSIRIVGCDDYPEEWESFMLLISGCLDLNRIKGNGKVFLNTIEPPLKHMPERRA